MTQHREHAEHLLSIPANDLMRKPLFHGSNPAAFAHRLGVLALTRNEAEVMLGRLMLACKISREDATRLVGSAPSVAHLNLILFVDSCRFIDDVPAIQTVRETIQEWRSADGNDEDRGIFDRYEEFYELLAAGGKEGDLDAKAEEFLTPIMRHKIMRLRATEPAPAADKRPSGR